MCVKPHEPIGGEAALLSGKGWQNYNPNFTGLSSVSGVVFLVISSLIAW